MLTLTDKDICADFAAEIITSSLLNIVIVDSRPHLRASHATLNRSVTLSNPQSVPHVQFDSLVRSNSTTRIGAAYYGMLLPLLKVFFILMKKTKNFPNARMNFMKKYKHTYRFLYIQAISATSRLPSKQVHNRRSSMSSLSISNFNNSALSRNISETFNTRLFGVDATTSSETFNTRSFVQQARLVFEALDVQGTGRIAWTTLQGVSH